MSPSLVDLATTLSQATADTARTEILPCAPDHVQDLPTAGGPGNDLPLLASPPLDAESWPQALPSPQFVIHSAGADGGGGLNAEVLFLRYDSYEEYQHERLKREEYRREYEKRESERAKQRERQRQKAIVSSLELTFVLQEGFFFSFPFLFAFFLGGGGLGPVDKNMR